MFRVLWLDHSWWTVMYCSSVIFHAYPANEAKQRLLENQIQIGQEFGKLLQNKKTGQLIGELLTAHIVAADNTLQAAANKSKTLQDKIDQLFAQGDDMCSQISHALELNEDDREHLKTEFHQHNQHVINLVTLLLGQKPLVAELNSYHLHMVHISDLLVNLAMQ